MHGIPLRFRYVSDGKFQQFLRLRFGVPPLIPPEEWRCNCKEHGGPADPDLTTGRCFTDPRDWDPHQITFADSPYHAFMCKRRWEGVGFRHDRVVEELMRRLRLMPGVSGVQAEPRTGDGQKRGDIRFARNGVTHILDVQVTCPATKAKVSSLRTHVRPGAAAAQAFERKKTHHSGVQNFMPIIVETGGRIHPESCAFIRDVATNGGSLPGDGAHPTFRSITNGLMRQQMYMLARIAEQLAARDRAADADLAISSSF